MIHIGLAWHPVDAVNRACQEDKDSLWYVCHNAPRWHAFHKESILNLNLDYDGGRDQVNPGGPFELTVRLPTGFPGRSFNVVLATPDQPGPDTILAYRVRNGRVAVQVPGLRIWSLVCVTAVAP